MPSCRETLPKPWWRSVSSMTLREHPGRAIGINTGIFFSGWIAIDASARSTRYSGLPCLWAWSSCCSWSRSDDPDGDEAIGRGRSRKPFMDRRCHRRSIAAQPDHGLHRCGTDHRWFWVPPWLFSLRAGPFPGKKLLESIIDLPIMIPHPVVGIALLSHCRGATIPSGKDSASWLGVQTSWAATTGLDYGADLFVGLPFYINTPSRPGSKSISVHALSMSRAVWGQQPLGRVPAGYPAAGLAKHMLVGASSCAWPARSASSVPW